MKLSDLAFWRKKKKNEASSDETFSMLNYKPIVPVKETVVKDVAYWEDRLSAENPMIAVYELESWAEYGSEVAVGILAEFLPKAKHHLIRERVCNSLGIYGGDVVLDALIGILNDDSDIVRRTAMDILGQIGDSRVIEPLNAFLNDPNFGEDADRALAYLVDRGIEGTQAIKNRHEKNLDFRQRVLAARERDKAWVDRR